MQTLILLSRPVKMIKDPSDIIFALAFIFLKELLRKKYHKFCLKINFQNRFFRNGNEMGIRWVGPSYLTSSSNFVTLSCLDTKLKWARAGRDAGLVPCPVYRVIYLLFYTFIF